MFMLVGFLAVFLLSALVFAFGALPASVAWYWRLVAMVPVAALMGSIVLLRSGMLHGAWQTLTALLFALVVAQVLMMPVLLFTLVGDHAGWPAGVVRSSRLVAWGIGIVTMVVMGIGSTYGWRHITTRDFAYTDERVPRAFEGYRIVQLSDFHLGTFRGHEAVVREVVERVNALRPDLIVFTGDLVSQQADEVLPHIAALRGLRARDGIYSVMGNHDYLLYHPWPTPSERAREVGRLQAAERSLGWHLLLNEHAIIARGGDTLAIVGIENDGRPPFPQRGRLDKACRHLPAGAFTLLLSHDPTCWRRRVVPDTDMALTLSGHTHGMQFGLLGWSPSAWLYPEWGGAYREGGQTLFVSTGIGAVGVPFRFGLWPEIACITLHRKA